MNRFQKIVLAMVIILILGSGLYAARQARMAKAEARRLQSRQASLGIEIEKLQTELAHAAIPFAKVREENTRQIENTDQIELLRLRGELGILKSQASAASQTASSAAQTLADKLAAQTHFILDDENRRQQASFAASQMRTYAMSASGRLPADLKEVTNAMALNPPKSGMPAFDLAPYEFANLGTKVYAGNPHFTLVDQRMNLLILFREKTARQGPDGKWYRIDSLLYQAVPATSDDGNFDAWEQANTYTPQPSATNW